MNTPITIQGWPLVEVCFNGPANEQEVQVWLDAMDALFEKNQPFGLLTRTSEHSDFSDAGRKAMGLWFKQSREKIGQLCVGVARIAPAEDAIDLLFGHSTLGLTILRCLNPKFTIVLATIPIFSGN